MCGIFGIFLTAQGALSPQGVRQALDVLSQLSQSRGREASGLVLRTGAEIRVTKKPVTASQFIRTPGYKRAFAALTDGAPLVAMGHSRLVTNGVQVINANNQPVIKNGVIAIHNGIIVNDSQLWAAHPHLKRETELDTEILADMLGDVLPSHQGWASALRSVFPQLEGTVSAALLSESSDEAVLATNHGSLYYCIDAKVGRAMFASERVILEQALSGLPELRLSGPVRHLAAGTALILGLDRLDATSVDLTSPPALPGAASATVKRAAIVDFDRYDDPANARLRRCSRCILPETFPFIEFDEQEVCNFCRNHVERPRRSLDELERLLAPLRGKDGRPDCLVAVSGGRDSCFGLHVLKKRLGMNPLAYTYDWGMVTDLARRNQARLCGRLGVEHILVSADIARKRANIRVNVEAWLRRPVLGLVPLFMAGDKQYFYHADRLLKQTGIPLLFYLENQRYEKTWFKQGFCGIDEGQRRIYDVSPGDKLRLAAFYGAEFARNPRYLNRSLVDTIGAYVSTYLLKHDFVSLYDYVEWDEDEVVSTLRSEYGWELAPDTQSTWRIGDGTAAFYNFIYYTMAGFTEHDTFRSNQIRAGVMSREDALRRVRVDNMPRWQSMEWYARTIGFDLTEAIRVISSAPKLYRTD